MDPPPSKDAGRELGGHPGSVQLGASTPNGITLRQPARRYGACATREERDGSHGGTPFEVSLNSGSGESHETVFFVSVTREV
jgi:hypothetical protein